MTVLMTAAAVYGVVQLFALSYPTRSVRLGTVLLALLAGVYVCGAAAALLEVTYTRTIADRTGRSLIEVANTTSVTMAPWVEELIKITPLLLIGAYAKVRRQWGLTDFTVLGAALGAGFGLLEALLRYSLDADRALARSDGWIIPDSLSPPYIPGPGQVATSWLPAPAASLELGQTTAITVPTFTHLVWTALAGLAVGVLWRVPTWWKPLAVIPFGAAVAHHTLTNHVVRHPTDRQARQWLEHLDGKAWLAPIVALLLAMTVDTVRLHHGKRNLPGVLLATERADGDSAAALIRYAAWRPPWTLLIARRFIRLRRTLCYAAAGTPPAELDPLRRTVADLATRIDATDHEQAWRGADLRAGIRSGVRAARATTGHRTRILSLIPCALLVPSVLFLCVGSFKSTVGLQNYFTHGAGPKILLGFAIAALAWIVWQSAMLLRTWRQSAANPLGERLAVHRLRCATALAAALTGTLLLRRSTGPAGSETRIVPSAHLLDALDNVLTYLGFALLLFSLLALFPPGAGLALAGVTVSGEGALGAALAARLGAAGIALMAAGAAGGGTGGGGGGGGGGSGGQDANPASPQQGSVAGDAVGGHRTASGIAKWAREQGWTETRTENGPPKFTDENGIIRVTLKQGSSRAPGSGAPHVEIRNAQGERIDPTGNVVTRKSPGNHTPITWDLP